MSSQEVILVAPRDRRSWGEGGDGGTLQIPENLPSVGGDSGFLKHLAQPGTSPAVGTGEEGAPDQLSTGNVPPASSRKHTGWVQNMWAANMHRLGEVPWQREARAGAARARRLGLAGRSALHPPQPTLSRLRHRVDGSREVSREGTDGIVPRRHGPLAGFTHLILPASTWARPGSRSGRPPGPLLTERKQKPDKQQEPRSQPGWFRHLRCLGATEPGHDSWALHTCSKGHGTSQKKSKRGNDVVRFIAKVQLVAGWRMNWAQRPELGKLRDTEEGTEGPTLALLVAHSWPRDRAVAPARQPDAVPDVPRSAEVLPGTSQVPGYSTEPLSRFIPQGLALPGECGSGPAGKDSQGGGARAGHGGKCSKKEVGQAGASGDGRSKWGTCWPEGGS